MFWKHRQDVVIIGLALQRVRGANGLGRTTLRPMGAAIRTLGFFLLARGRYSRIITTAILSVILFATFTLNVASDAGAQDLSWVRDAMERSKLAPSSNLPVSGYDPRVAAGSGDATLRDLACPTKESVWAVGDRGLILASGDGGRTWHQQNSGTTVNLHAVAFLNDQQGFVVGGMIQPMSQMSVGIVLATEDGGAHWRVVNRDPVARLTGLMVTDRAELRAWGDYSNVHSSAIVESLDRGQSWRPIASPLGHLQSVARHGRGLQLGVDRAGRLSQLPASSDHALLQLGHPTSPIAAIAHTGSQWLAVGNGGTLATSVDGRQWVDRPVPLSAAARAACDFRCVTILEGHVWVAGSPGSIVQHSSDRGQTWQLQTTGQTWPVNDMAFIDPDRGWAVTDAGAILATADGGATWSAQRLPVKRLGLQAFATSLNNIAWPALADATWQSRQATALNVIHRENTEDAVGFTPDGPATLATVGVQTGLLSASLSSAYPLPDRRVRDARKVGAMYAEAGRFARPGHTLPITNISADLTLQLRVGRPSVVLVNDQLSDGGSYLTEAVVRAMSHAARDEPEYLWLSNELKLPPWQATKLFASCPPGKSDFTITTDQLLRDSGLSVIDALAPLLGFESASMHDSAIRCLQIGQGATATRNTLFHTNDRQPDATRSVDLSKVGNIQLVMGRVHRDRAWQSLISNPHIPLETHANWLKKLQSITDKTPRHEVGPALVKLSELTFQATQWSQWYSALERGADHEPQSDTARWSSLQLLWYGASDERAAWQRAIQLQLESSGNELAAGLVADLLPNALGSTPFDNVSAPRRSEVDAPHPTVPSGAGAVVGAVVQASALVTSQERSGGVAMAAATGPLAVDDPTDHARAVRVYALKRAASDFSKLAERDKALMLRPDVQMAHFARRRALAEQAGEPAPDPGALQGIANASQLAGWRQVAEQELVLASGRKTLPSWTARAYMTAQPPQLDGRGDEACWQQALPIEMTTPFYADPSEKPSRVQFTYDAEYLYVMLTCPSASGDPTNDDSSSSGIPQPRKYDMELSGTDHVLLTFDTDRDYSSACQLAVNQHGHTFDRCCEASQWNPRWYVAVQRDAQTWSAELAIKLADLTTADAVTGRAWAISAFRYMPQRDVQSWTQLRSYNPRHQGSGLLLFDP